MGSFFAACSRPVKESLGGAKVCARLVLEMIRSAVTVTFKQTSLRTSASYAANPTDFVRELIVRVADFSCAGKRANHRFDGNSHARAERPYVGDCSLLYEHAREPVFPRRRRFLFAQRL